MPVHKGSDKSGSYYQWGDQGKKYYTKQYGENGAKERAARQGRAAYANGYKGK